MPNIRIHTEYLSDINQMHTEYLSDINQMHTEYLSDINQICTKYIFVISKGMNVKIRHSCVTLDYFHAEILRSN